MSRTFDFIIYGATGYTAQIAIDYLLSSATGKAFKWAVAGRNASKLDAVLKARSEAFEKAGIAVPEVIVASVDDPASLDAMCSKATVLMAMAGPYALCGLPVVGACVRNGTHYVDITGEFQFIRQAIEQYHDEAEAKKVSIVTTCGFDCVPSDIGSLMMHDHVAKVSNGADSIQELAGYFELEGGAAASGGTAHSIANLFATIDYSKDMTPLSLVPLSLRKGVPTPMQRFIGYSSALKRYTAPFIMAGGNERIVRRSNALLGRPTTSYWEAAVSKSLLEAVGLLVGIAVIGVFFAVRPLRYLTTKYILPRQGEGPSAGTKKNNAYTATFMAKTKSGKVYKGLFVDQRNLYDSTGVFVVEAAATLVEMVKKEGNAAIRGGVITPAAAFGSRYLERLHQNKCGITTSVEEVSKSK